MTIAPKRVRIYTPEQRARAVIRATLWAKAHPERRKKIEAKYRKSEKGIRRATMYARAYYRTQDRQAHLKKYRAANRVHKNEVNKRWGKINRESIRRTHRKHVKKAWGNLKDYMLRAYCKQRGISPTQQNIETCRQRIQLKRVARTTNLHAASQQLLKALQPSEQPSLTVR